MGLFLFFVYYLFQHTAARRRLDKQKVLIQVSSVFQHTAARRRLDYLDCIGHCTARVSTHSRPKAAG